MGKLLRTIALVCAAAAASANGLKHTPRIGPSGLSFSQYRRLTSPAFGNALGTEEHEVESEASLPFPTHTLEIPVDHFHNESQYAPHSNAKFSNRYWFDASHYKPGGPVIVLLGGETTGVERLVYMQDGILAQLAQATNGIAVVLEHRYYGNSFPTPNLSTENLRFLTTQQALADTAYFAQNVQFPGLAKYGNLTAEHAPWITYGGSYAGAFSAFLRVQYPEIFWGSISSSGVTEAIYDYWAYYEPVATYGPPSCISAIKLFTNAIDNIFAKNNAKLTHTLKAAFDYPNVTYSDDVASWLSYGISLWQSLNWDPAVSYDGLYVFCSNISSHQVLYPNTESRRAVAEQLLTAGGYPKPNTTLVNQMLNYIGWNYANVASTCTSADQDSCFAARNPAFYGQTSLAQWSWRSWAYQYCSKWGFFQTGSGVPANQMPVISRLINLEYTSIVCEEAFNITTPSDVAVINKYGGYKIRADRLAIIDGQWDPWRPATPHAFQYGAPHRTSTTDEPFILISKALHHYDENGVPAKEYTNNFPPAPVQDTQAAERKFVEAWVKEWAGPTGYGGKGTGAEVDGQDVLKA